MTARGRTSVSTDWRQLLLAALASGLSLPMAFAASSVNAQGKKLVVGFSIWDLTIPFAVPFAAALKDTAEKNNIELRLVEAKFDASVQARQIAEFIVRKVDVICATPVDVRAILPAARSAKAAGIHSRPAAAPSKVTLTSARMTSNTDAGWAS